MWGPPVISWIIYPSNYSYKYKTIVIGVMFTNLAIERGPHIVHSIGVHKPTNPLNPWVPMSPRLGEGTEIVEELPLFEFRIFQHTRRGVRREIRTKPARLPWRLGQQGWAKACLKSPLSNVWKCLMSMTTYTYIIKYDILLYNYNSFFILLYNIILYTQYALLYLSHCVLFEISKRSLANHSPPWGEG